MINLASALWWLLLDGETCAGSCVLSSRVSPPLGGTVYPQTHPGTQHGAPRRDVNSLDNDVMDIYVCFSAFLRDLSPFLPSHDSLCDSPLGNLKLLMLPLPGFQTLSPFY